MPTCQCANTTIHYQREGNGPTLLLLHGLGSSHRDWQAQIDAFKSNFDVIAPDFPLHGESNGDIHTFSLPYCARIIHALLDELEVDQAIVIGISMGGMVGLELAIHHPQKVARLAVVNALAECKPRRWNEWWMLLSRRFLLAYVSVENIAKLMAKQLLPGKGLEKARENAVARWSRNERESYIAAFNAVVNWSVTGKLAAVRCPIFILSAEHDYTPVGAKKVLAYIYPEGEMDCLTGAHHLAPLEAPEQFNQRLSLWLLNTEHVSSL
ncbi:alpha/beta hydrolase [Enterovibrio norvegicus]|uniref:alpha/beta fold hydrolase n=1 Tax=Enterovibrio norvegicus TaxID=188144 RepID=UPI000C84CFB3|nr:alpha/beta hydrolase [Enterovibrio norvegicus]MCC4798420.1 alpha/beta hydrolase [Enterovibrio norvegicus]PMI33241.1 alpha/beta hydrolase [Enterovibrio norvegicus]PML78362.1 alpha/beta hydrolase [Enterovibrio norvegicus]PMN48208.1 alpha/beta hydrolase [Enterovibrio norvegicus]